MQKRNLKTLIAIMFSCLFGCFIESTYGQKQAEGRDTSNKESIIDELQAIENSASKTSSGLIKSFEKRITLNDQTTEAAAKLANLLREVNSISTDEKIEQQLKLSFEDEKKYIERAFEFADESEKQKELDELETKISQDRKGLKNMPKNPKQNSNGS